MNDHRFSQTELLRFSRHFPVIGIMGQQKLKQAKILCVGAGGLASPALLYLTAAGVGQLGIVDNDQVELSNISRQILYEEADLGQPKVVCAKQRLVNLNHSVSIIPYHCLLNENNAAKIMAPYDVIIDGSDNFVTRYLVNKYCRKLQKPLVSASLLQFSGQLSVFNYQGGPCFECLYPEIPHQDFSPNCAASGILGVVPGIFGTLQALEAIKVILGENSVLSGRLLCMDVFKMQFSQYEFVKHPGCSTDSCGQTSQTNASSPIRQSLASVRQITPTVLFDWLKNNTEMDLIDVRQPFEREICHIGGKLIPLNEFLQSLHQIPRDKKIVLYCKKGFRSEQAAQLLVQARYPEVYSLAGGILDWIDQVQPELMKY